MHQGILHQRLHQQFGNAAVGHLFIQLNQGVKTVPVPEFLQFHILAQGFHLAAHRDHLVGRGQAAAQNLDKGGQHPAGLLVAMHVHHALDGKQGVVHEVGVNLGLQPVQLHVPLLFFLGAHTGNQFPDAGQHAGHAPAQVIGLGKPAAGKGAVQIPLFHRFYVVPQPADGPGNLAGKMPGQRRAARHGDQRHQHHHTANVHNGFQHIDQGDLLKHGKAAFGIIIPGEQGRSPGNVGDDVVVFAEHLLQIAHAEIGESDDLLQVAGYNPPTRVGDVDVAAFADYVGVGAPELPFVGVDHQIAQYLSVIRGDGAGCGKGIDAQRFVPVAGHIHNVAAGVVDILVPDLDLGIHVVVIQRHRQRAVPDSIR